MGSEMIGDWMSVIEGLLFVSPTPLTLQKLKEILDPLTSQQIRDHLQSLQSLYEERNGALQVKEIAGGYQFYTRPEIAPWTRKLMESKPAKLSRASLETLAIIAYNQPTSKSEVDSVRGVDSHKAIRNLLEKGLIRVMGRKDEAGRPLLYGTTKRFLERFGLKDLASLPALDELQEMGMMAEED
jgi:segregation and condensation protein B